MAIPDFSTVGLYPVQGRARQDRELANLLLARGMNGQNTTTGLGAIGQGLSVVGALMGGRQANRSEGAANDAERQAEVLRMAQGGAAADDYMQGAADGGGRSIVDRIAAALGSAQEPVAPGPQVGAAAVQPTGPGAAPGGTPPGFPGASATPSAAFASLSAPARSQGGSSGPSEGYYARMAAKESGGDPNARNASGASGLYQFMPQTWAQYGAGADVRDPNAQQAAMERFTADNARVLSGQGVPVNDDTLALAHQQGAGGAVKLLRNPNGRAVDTVGAAAVRQNGGDENMTNAQFAQHVMGYYSGGAGGSSLAFGGGAGASGVAAGPNLPANMDPLERLYLSRMQNFTGSEAYGQELEGGYIGALDRAKYGADRSDEAWRRDFSERELAQRAAEAAERLNQMGRGEIWGVSPQYGLNPETGAPGMFIQSNMGNTKWLPMDPTPQTQFLNTGTGFAPVDKRTGVAVPGAEGVAIDNAGKAADTEVGKQTGTAITSLPQHTEGARQAILAGNDLLADPYFDNMFGSLAGSALGVNITQDANSAQARIDRFVNQTAPMAMETLRGLGPASDADRQGAQAAITNLRDNPRMRPEEARAEVQRFMDHVRHALAASQNAAQGNFAPAVTVPPPGPAVPPAPGPAQRVAPVTINGYTIERE